MAASSVVGSYLFSIIPIFGKFSSYFFCGAGEVGRSASVSSQVQDMMHTNEVFD